MTEPEQAAMRSGGERARAAGHPTHPPQDDDGAWFDVPCNCDRTGSADQMIADLELLRSGGPVIDRAMREAGFLIEEPHHARGRERTDEEAAVLAPKFATGGVVRSGPVVVGDSDGCAYPVPFDNGGILRPGMAWYRNDTGHVVPLDPTKPLPAGVVRLSDVERQPTDDACCQVAYDSDGFAHDHEVTR